MKNLKELDLENTQIKDNWLESIVSFKKLTKLNISRTDITDRGFVQLGKIHNLEVLMCRDVPLTRSGLNCLRFLLKIQRLDLDNTKIHDDDFENIQFENLRELYLSGTPFSDKGLAEFNRFKKLKLLELYGTKVTKKGVEGLRKTMPKTHIYYE